MRLAFLIIPLLLQIQIQAVEYELWRDVGIVQQTWIIEAMEGTKEVHYIIGRLNGKPSYMFRSDRLTLCWKCPEGNRWWRKWKEIPYDYEIEHLVMEFQIKKEQQEIVQR